MVGLSLGESWEELIVGTGLCWEDSRKQNWVLSESRSMCLGAWDWHMHPVVYGVTGQWGPAI